MGQPIHELQPLVATVKRFWLPDFAAYLPSKALGMQWQAIRYDYDLTEDHDPARSPTPWRPATRTPPPGVVVDPHERWIASGGWDDRVVFLDPLRATRGDPIAVERHWRVDLHETSDAGAVRRCPPCPAGPPDEGPHIRLTSFRFSVPGARIDRFLRLG